MSKDCLAAVTSVCSVLIMATCIKHYALANSYKQIPLMHDSHKTEQVIESGATLEGFHLISKASASVLTPNRPVVVTIVQQNISDKALAFMDMPPESGYKIVVTDIARKVVPLTQYGKDLKQTKEAESMGFHIHGFPIIMLQAGQSKQYQVQISRIYDMTEAGDYLISFQRNIPTLDGKRRALLVSAPIHVTIVEPDPSAAK